MSEKKAVFYATLSSGLLGACLGFNWYFNCSPEKRPLQFLLRMTIVAGVSQFLYARVLNRYVLYDNSQKRARKTQTKGGLFGEILGVFARTCAWYITGVIVLHLAAVLCGAPLFENFYGTFLWAAMISALTFLPIGIVTGENDPEWMLEENVSSERAKWFVGVPALSTIIGAWVGAIAIPLDWHEPWQKWPIPCTYSALFGYFIGVMLVCLLLPLIPKHKRVNIGSKVSELVQKQRSEEDSSVQPDQSKDDNQNQQQQRRRKGKH